MTKWINVLHLYQPPTQGQDVVERVVRECYALIPQLLKKFPQARWTLNISGSLLELLETFGYQSLLEEYRSLAEAGRIELMGSAMYHPILPLLPPEEANRQISLNNSISRRVFGDGYRPKGFHLPEMAYSRSVADTIASFGFEWIILDEYHFPQGKPRSDTRYVLPKSNLRVLFRDRVFSKTFPPRFVPEHRKDIVGDALIIAHDGELYGHWHKNDEDCYAQAFTDPSFEQQTVSEYLSGLKKEAVVEPREGSWESLGEELQRGEPFHLWNDPQNAIHQALWDFARFVLRTVADRENDVNYPWARKHADRGLASCAWWWASGAKLVATAPVSWSPEDIGRGAAELMRAIRSLENLDVDLRLTAEADYSRLRTMIWTEHWQKHHHLSTS